MSVAANAGRSNTQTRQVVAGEDIFFLHSRAPYVLAEVGPICISPVMLGGASGNVSLQA
jgi:hypothetical protein